MLMEPHPLSEARGVVYGLAAVIPFWLIVVAIVVAAVA
jgi:hypothetical protein